MGGRVAPMEYRITELRAPATGSSSSAPARASRRSTTSASSASATGPSIDYTADIRLGGLLRLAQPFLGGAFATIGRDAADGHGADARRTALPTRRGPTGGSA